VTNPTVTAVAASSASSDIGVGQVVTVTATFSDTVVVSGGTPTLTLNDGETASYTGGSGTDMLTFEYTVLPGDTTPQLGVTGSALNGASIQDLSGDPADLTGLVGTPTGAPQIDTNGPTVTAVAASSASSDIGVGQVVTMTATFSDTVMVSGGTPTLILNDGETASYTGVSGSDTLTFDYAVLPGDNTAQLAVTGSDLAGATILDGSGDPADLTGLVGTPSGAPKIDTNGPTVTAVAASAASSNIGVGQVVTMTATFSDAVVVSGGTPTLTLNDGETAGYAGGSGTDTLTFGYTVLPGDNTAQLAVTGSDLAGATILDGSGDPADLTGVVGTPTGAPQIDTNGPTVTAVAASATSSDIGVGQVVTLTSTFSDIVTVSGGTPTLTLNDGETASYTGGSGTDTLTFGYTVLPGDNTAQLTVTGSDLAGATILDGAGDPADLTGVVGTPTGAPQIDTNGPTVTAVAASSASSDIGVGQVVTLMATFSDAVTVSGGTPTLTLNDGETASYTGGSGTDTLTFGYTVLPGDNTAQLAVTGSDLAGATILDGAGNPADLAGAIGVPTDAPRIDTTTPTVTAVAVSSASSDIGVGQVVTLTATFNDIVTVSGGMPTLTLNDGETAGYAGGSGTDTLTFDYTVLPGDNTPQLAVTGSDLAGATILDGAGNAADLAGVVGDPAGAPQIDTTAPTVTAVAASSASSDIGVGQAVTLTATFSEAVTVSGGSPSLTLNDGETASYAGGSGTDTLTFGYTVLPGDNTPRLAVTGSDLEGATIRDGAGNPADLTGVVGVPAGAPQIDTTGSAQGDVHMVTFDGLHYDFQAVGDFTLTRSMVADNSFDVQIRTAPYPINDLASITTQVAAQVGDNSVLFDLGGGVTVNGVADTAPGTSYATQLFDGGKLVMVSPDTYQIDWTNGEALTVSNEGICFNLGITLSAGDGPDSVQGLLGSDSGQASDFQLPDGTVLAPPVSDSELLGEFADAWRVAPDQSMLTETIATALSMSDQGPGTAMAFTVADRPDEILTGSLGTASATVTYAGTMATLAGDVLSGFTAGDAIDITDLYGGCASLSFVKSGSGGDLTIANGSQNVMMHVSGPLPSGGFSIASDQHAGSLIVFGT